jgi:hypothetical protein
MDPRLANIQQLVAESTYPIDESVIAEAILVRAAARRLVPDLAFRQAPLSPRCAPFDPTAVRGPFAWLGCGAGRWAARPRRFT